jgi:hypothetical protein
MASQDSMDRGSTSRRTTGEEDHRYQAAVLLHILDLYPQTVRIIELIREMTGGQSTFAQRDYIRRAITDLMAAGLLFRVGDAVIQPTRAAVVFHELAEL